MTEQRFSTGSYDLRMTIGEEGDQVLLKDWFSSSYENRRIAQFQFADGTALTPQELLEQLPVSATRNSTLNGNEGVNDILIAAEGSSLYGKSGNDLLSGANKARLYGGDGDDTLIAQDSENQLWGGAGNDRFVIGLGSGTTTIYADDAEGSDTLLFGQDIGLGDIQLEKSGSSDLRMTIDEDRDDTLDAQEEDKQFWGETLYPMEVWAAAPPA